MRMEASDESLALAAAAGDADAFSALLHRHYDRLLGLTFRLTGQKADAEDLTQDVCAVLPRKLGSFRGDAKFTTWLYRVAVNAAHDRRRRASTRARMATGWGDWEIDRRAADAETKEAADWLHTAMALLTDDLRDTLALTLDEGLTQAEAATILGVSEGTVAWRISEVKKRLRTFHEQELDV